MCTCFSAGIFWRITSRTGSMLLHYVGGRSIAVPTGVEGQQQFDQDQVGVVIAGSLRSTAAAYSFCHAREETTYFSAFAKVTHVNASCWSQCLFSAR